MAERRMFAKTIIDSDAFLEMPLSAQCLYFHLSMRADDDGFVNSPKRVMRLIGAAEDDLKLLIAKRFLIPFESGIVVIKHWKIHNYIRNDRYHETTYQEEKAQLTLKDNRAYSLDTDGIPNGYQLDTQIRIDKNRQDKNRVVEEDRATPPTSELDQIKTEWNAIGHCKPINDFVPGTRRWDETQICIHMFGFEKVLEAIRRIRESEYLKARGSVAYDNYINRDTLQKVLEGNYDELYKSAGQAPESDYERSMRILREGMQ